MIDFFGVGHQFNSANWNENEWFPKDRLNFGVGPLLNTVYFYLPTFSHPPKRLEDTFCPSKIHFKKFDPCCYYYYLRI